MWTSSLDVKDDATKDQVSYLNLNPNRFQRFDRSIDGSPTTDPPFVFFFWFLAQVELLLSLAPWSVSTRAQVPLRWFHQCTPSLLRQDTAAGWIKRARLTCDIAPPRQWASWATCRVPRGLRADERVHTASGGLLVDRKEVRVPTDPNTGREGSLAS